MSYRIEVKWSSSALAHMKTLTHNLAEEMTKEGQA